jgi:hypothetical protein
MALAVPFIVLNWYCVLLFAIKRKYCSWIPLIGGVLGSVGFYLSPFDLLHGHWWIPLILDWGSVPGLTYTGIGLVVMKMRS